MACIFSFCYITDLYNPLLIFLHTLTVPSISNRRSTRPDGARTNAAGVPHEALGLGRDESALGKFWYFLSRLRKVKKANGQIIACNEIFEKDDTTVKNYGVWIRYQSRVGFHNAYKEYRETTMNAAVDALYTEMASRHRVRSHALQIIKIAEVANEDVRRERERHETVLADDVSFPVVRKTLRHDSKSQKTTFKYQRPNFAIL